MGYYDLFSTFYDRSVAALYHEYRQLAKTELELQAGQHAVDVGCGTGLSLDVLAPSVGSVVGVDGSRGMLKRASRRVQNAQWKNVTLLQQDLTRWDESPLRAHVREHGLFDRALFFLILSALPSWDATFEKVWELTKPGGKVVIVDAHTECLGFIGRMVNLTARADIRRPVWSALEQRATSFSLQRLDADKRIGGDMILAQGTKG